MKNGDPITIDTEKRKLGLEVPSAELKQRKQAWKKPAPRYSKRCRACRASPNFAKRLIGVGTRD